MPQISNSTQAKNNAAFSITTEGKGEYQNTKLDRWNFVRRGLALKNEGQLWYSAWKDLSKYIYPTKGFFYEQRPNQGYEIDHKTVIDGYATQSVDTLASGMTSGLTSPSRPWFKLGLENTQLMTLAAVKYWLDDVQQSMLGIFQKSNIYGILNSIYAEIGTFGTACCYLEDDYNKVIRGRNYTAGEYYLGAGPDGKINAFYRRFWMTVGQLVEEFGLENCCPAVQTAWKNNTPDVWRVVNHLIEVNDDRIPFLKDYRNMEFRSCYWEDGAMPNSYLRLGGYEEFPILAPRWDVVTTADAYGRGPGWKALGDVKMLQKLQKQKLIALDKVINPPIQVDASVQGEANMLPGGVTKFSAMLPNAGVKAAYEVRPDLNAIELSIEKTRQGIGKYFFTDLFLMMIDAERSGTPITATEVTERQSEKLSMLGPVLERLEGELLSPLIERTFAIMLRNNLIPKPPQEMAGQEIKIQYISILAQAQKMQGINGMSQWVGSTASLAQASPEILDNINFDMVSQESADMLGVPAKIVNTPEQIAKIRNIRAKKQAAMAQAQNMAVATDLAAKGAKATKDMAQSPMGQGSALDELLAPLTGKDPNANKAPEQ